MMLVRPSATIAVVALALAAALTATLTPIAHAQDYDYVELPPEFDARAASLYEGIMCPICNGQTISQSHTAIAETMRGMIREQLLSGATDEEVYLFMVRSFDESILAKPPKSGVALGVWVIPPVGVLIGAIAVFFAVRAMRGAASSQRGAAPTVPPVDAETARLLEMVDREMSDGTDGSKR
jgi:cytochrome c-type biogenesis protein CcmH